MDTTIKTITRDEIRDSAHPRWMCYIINYGAGARAQVLSVDGDVGYAQSLDGRTLVRFVRTGEVVRSNQLTVAVTVARDTGDKAGTLRFDGVLAMRGRAHRDLFGF